MITEHHPNGYTKDSLTKTMITVQDASIDDSSTHMSLFSLCFDNIPQRNKCSVLRNMFASLYSVKTV